MYILLGIDGDGQSQVVGITFYQYVAKKMDTLKELTHALVTSAGIISNEYKLTSAKTELFKQSFFLDTPRFGIIYQM